MTTMSSYTQFGYPYTSASQLLMSSGAPSSGAGPSAGSVGAPSPGGGSGISGGSSGAGSVASAGGSGSVAGNVASGATSPCCDSGRPLVTDPVTGQTVCSCQYDRLQALSAYGPSAAAAAAARLAAVSSAVTGVSGLHGIYSNTYPSTDQNPYPSLGMDSTTAFYSSLANPYSLKEGGPAPGDVAGWSGPGLQTAPGYYPYDPTLAAYGYGASYDLAARRKNATRESTATLKAWLSEHKKNPYPTKGEKIMLAIITKMTLTQVSTWFANARRRLKKENKMTWEPKNRNDDDDDDDCSAHSDDESKPIKDKHSKHHLDHHKGEGDDKSDCDDDSRGSMSPHSSVGSGSCAQVNENGVSVSVSVSNLNGCQLNPAMGASSMAGDLHHLGGVSSNQHVKPKIWSLADTAACKTPPPPLPLPHGPSHASAASNGIAAAPPAPHSWFGVSGGCHVNPMATMSSMASMAGGGNMMNGMANMASMGKIGAGFGAYARYPPLAGYHAGGGGYATGASHVVHGASGAYGLSSTQLPYACDVQTDTPPQTPPNLKVNATAGLLGSHQYVSPSGIVANRPNSSMMAAPSANSNSSEHADMAAHLSSPHRQSMSAPMGASSSSHPQTGAASADSTAFRPVYRTSPIGGYATSS